MEKRLELVEEICCFGWASPLSMAARLTHELQRSLLQIRLSQCK